MPIYEYHCMKCGENTDEFQHIRDEPLTKCSVCGHEGLYNRVPQLGHCPQLGYHKPIQMHSIALCHQDEIEAFQRRNPDIKISTNPDDPLYGVPIAETRHQKNSILKTEGFVEKN